MPAAQTVCAAVCVEGTGLHTGQRARVEIRPRAQGGRVFVCAGVEIPARVDCVTDTRRSTTLGRDGVQVRTVEHLLAALALADIDHASIHIDGPELPALDGAAAVWHAAIMTAGAQPTGEDAPEVCIREPWWMEDGGSRFFVSPASEYGLHAAVHVPETVVDHWMAGGDVADPAVREQILRARTYGLEREVQALLDNGLARGGSLDNAVVLTEDGYLNAQVWPHEPAWHKVLDLAGDLALVGARIRGRVLAVQGGHATHVTLARRLRAEVSAG